MTEEATRIGCRGFCARCGRDHSLPAEPALKACRALMAELEARGRIDLTVRDGQADPRLSLNYLHGPARGQMFGVMVCETQHREQLTFKAFSGQYNGMWQVAGWVPPVLDPARFESVTRDTEARIKRLGRALEFLSPDQKHYRELHEERRRLSRNLMRRIHDLYTLHNFRGQSLPMREAFLGKGNMPTGTGDCCAPKLLNHAARNNLRPIGLAEFYMGRENRSGTRKHGEFSASCQGKCAPILGFMLCGLED